MPCVALYNNIPVAHAEVKDKPLSSLGFLHEAPQILKPLNTARLGSRWSYSHILSHRFVQRHLAAQRHRNLGNACLQLCVLAGHMAQQQSCHLCPPVPLDVTRVPVPGVSSRGQPSPTKPLTHCPTVGWGEIKRVKVKG